MGVEQELGEAEASELRRAAFPSWLTPAAATLTDQRFSRPDWLFERKLDGERSLIYAGEGELEMRSRTRKPQRARYPELVEALEDARGDRTFVADGEVVAFEGGQTSFSRLQKRIQVADPERARRSGVAVKLYLFDLLHLDGYDLRGLGLRGRKRLLGSLLEYRDPLRLLPHENERGEELFEDACARGWEGLIAKRADSTYPSGRSRDWLKFKCEAGQELVVVGFTDPRGARTGLGALLLAHNADGGLRYAGKVGTGFDQATLPELRRRLDRLARQSSPLAAGEDVPGERSVHWVRPELVVQVGFSEWTADGRLRHPRFQGVRTDKRPIDVVRESR